MKLSMAELATFEDVAIDVGDDATAAAVSDGNEDGADVAVLKVLWLLSVSGTSFFSLLLRSLSSVYASRFNYLKKYLLF